jgi:hypothetical protein
MGIVATGSERSPARGRAGPEEERLPVVVALVPPALDVEWPRQHREHRASRMAIGERAEAPAYLVLGLAVDEPCEGCDYVIHSVEGTRFNLAHVAHGLGDICAGHHFSC